MHVVCSIAPHGGELVNLMSSNAVRPLAIPIPILISTPRLSAYNEQVEPVVYPQSTAPGLYFPERVAFLR
jgi:hypothetical protein